MHIWNPVLTSSYLIQSCLQIGSSWYHYQYSISRICPFCSIHQQQQLFDHQCQVVCLCATICKNASKDFNENFRMDWKWYRKSLLISWCCGPQSGHINHIFQGEEKHDGKENFELKFFTKFWKVKYHAGNNHLESGKSPSNSRLL